LRARFEDYWVEDGQRDEGKLLLALVQRKVVGHDGATVRLTVAFEVLTEKRGK
jgi:hypothetical protein